ncbi:MAG: hypothetical protein IKC87_01735 [Clostridia bacterium]|nr:hypothetical protein [Clostridia bacterium]
MGANFLRFKNKAFIIRLSKSILSGAAVGTLTAGVLLLLMKLMVMELIPWIVIVSGLGGAMLSFGLSFLLLGGSDMTLARRLDTEFSLKEKVRTMVEYRDGEGAMLAIQREDAEESLSRIPTKSFKAKRLWIYIVAVCLGAAMLLVGIFAPDQRKPDEDEIVPFELSAMQRAGINELISYVDGSGAEAAVKSALKDELAKLLEQLEDAETVPEMQAILSTSLTEITKITYDSSSVTEILTSMWTGADALMRVFAKSLDTSKWDEPEWGDFAEGFMAFRNELGYTGEAETSTEDELIADLRWKLDAICLKTDNSLKNSRIAEDDKLYAVIARFLYADGVSSDGKSLSGLKKLLTSLDSMTHAQALIELDHTFEVMSNEIYAVLAELKINANTGEYVLSKLSVLFGAPIPKFERPNLKDPGESGSNDEDKDEDSVGGGVGEGVQYGSNDLVLDPITGKYVEYGTLYSAYNALMIEKLEGPQCSYTEEQKKAIQKYFALLYSGFDDED